MVAAFGTDLQGEHQILAYPRLLNLEWHAIQQPLLDLLRLVLPCADLYSDVDLPLGQLPVPVMHNLVRDDFVAGRRRDRGGGKGGHGRHISLLSSGTV